MTFLLTFIVLSIVNVIFSTVRSITTIKSGKTIASLVSGGYFAFYNIVLLWTVADFPMWQKCVITFCCNVVGVYVVKLIEEKIRKDKLWLVKMTIPTERVDDVKDMLDEAKIPFSEFKITNYTVFDCYCQTQKDTLAVTKIANGHNGKMFATENKL